MDDFADAVIALEEAVDRAVHQALLQGLSHKEAADELRRIARGWEEAA